MKHIALRGVCIHLVADQTIKQPNKYELHCIIICTASFFYFIIIFVFITSVNVHCLNGKTAHVNKKTRKNKTMSSFSECEKKNKRRGQGVNMFDTQYFMNKMFLFCV